MSVSDAVSDRVGNLERWQKDTNRVLYGDSQSQTQGLVQKARLWDETAQQVDRIVASAKWLAATFGLFGLGLLLNVANHLI